MSFASVIANRAVLSVAATRAHAKSSNRRSLIVKAEGEEIAETETPAPAPAVSRDEDAKIFVDESFGLIFFYLGTCKTDVATFESAFKVVPETSEGCFRASFPTSAKFESEVLFFDTQPEIRLISKEISKIHFRVARA